MSINSKQKGKQGELELCRKLREIGIEAKRSQQFKGTVDSADLDILNVDDLFVESKRVEKLNLSKVLERAELEAEYKLAVVCHRRNREEWIISLRLSEVPRLVKMLEKLYDEGRPDERPEDSNI